MARTSVLGAATKVEAVREDHKAVEVVGRAVASAAHVTVRRDGGEEIELPESLLRILRIAAQELSVGRSITVLASETVLTPAEAAELLGLSRPFVARLLDQGHIPSEHLPESSHRVVRLTDVIAFQAKRERRRAGAERLTEIIESEDLPY